MSYRHNFLVFCLFVCLFFSKHKLQIFSNIIFLKSFNTVLYILLLLIYWFLFGKELTPIK